MFADKALLVLIFHVFTANILLGAKDDVDLDSLKVIFYYGRNMEEDFKIYDLNEAPLLLQHPKFIHNQTTCHIPGYTNHRHNVGTNMMLIAHLKRNTTNFLYLDWEQLANGDYTSAQENVFKLSPRFADFIIDLFDNGLDEDTFSLTGQSMGARALAVVGQDLIERSLGTMVLARITALDPSNEEAHDPFILPVIQKSHARFVDVIHTDAGMIGTRIAMGHANFWPNNGTPLQPGCVANFRPICSHTKGLVYWAESIAHTKGSEAFLAYPSGSYEKLLQDGPEKYKKDAVLMGVDCVPSARGDYYLEYTSNLDQYFFPTPPPPV